MRHPMRRATIVLLAATMLAGLGGGATRADPTGTWLTQSGETRVRIAPCGAASCGTVVWRKAPGTDVKNPDPAMRNRPIVGIQMFSGVKKTGDNEWTGELYNFEDGRTYTGKLGMQGDDRLKLSGCVLGGLVCRSQIWTRVP
jgi:uncharacterized protein (DUF2147 family)